MISKAILRQCVTVLPAYMMMLTAGIGYGWVAPMIPKLTDPNSNLKISLEDCSWIASIQYLIRVVSSFLSAGLLDRIGRAGVIVVASSIQFLTWIAVLVMTQGVFSIYLNRILYGVASGLVWSSYTVYITENSCPRIRGRVAGLAVFFFKSGQVVSFTLIPRFSFINVHLVIAAIALLSLLSTLLLRETPQFLVLKGKGEKAEIYFKWLNVGECEGTTRAQFEEIVNNVTEEKAMSVREIARSPYIIRGVRVSMIASFLLMATGSTAMNSFITALIPDTKYLAADTLMLIIGVTLLLSTCLTSSVIMDRFNRRTLFFLSLTVSAFLYVIVVAVHSVPSAQNSACFTWIMIITTVGTICIWASVLTPLTTCVRGEVLPQSIKPLGMSLAVTSSSVGAFMSVWTFLPLNEMYGIRGNFIFFAFICITMGIYIYFDVPETRGKTLVHIQMEMKQRGDNVVDIDYKRLTGQA